MVSPNRGAAPNTQTSPAQNQQANDWRQLEGLTFGQSIEENTPNANIDNQPDQTADPTVPLNPDDHPETQQADTDQTQAETTSQPEAQKSFTQQELERIAYLVQDSENDANISADSQIVKDINLKIKHDQYQKIKQQIEAAQQRKQQSNGKISDSIQFSTFEDLDTAKRELEEAMYIANPKFAQIDEEQRRHALKDKATYGELPEKDGTPDSLRARIAYRRVVNAKAEKRQIIYDEKRRIEAEKMAQQLDDISQQIGETEEYKKYSAMAKGDYATPDLKQRRQGVENAGSDGLFGKKGTRNVDSIDWELSPHNPDSLSPEDEPDPDPNSDSDLEPDDPENNPNGNNVDLGDTRLHPEKEELDAEKQERVEQIKTELDEMTADLAELYAKNRRLFVGKENREAFEQAQQEYEAKLDEYLHLKAEASYEQQKQEIFDSLGDRIDELSADIEQQLIDFCGDPENTEKTQEEVDEKREELKREAERILNEEYLDQVAEVRKQVSAQFIEDYIDQANDLQDATIDKLDNGTKCRKFVSKVLKNKWLKRGLVVAGAVGLAATGVGLVAGVAGGTMAVGFGLTATGAAAGAARGGAMGALMSRQDSKTSAINKFGQINSDQVRERLQNVDVLDPNSDAAHVGDWLMHEYGKENTADRSSNRKRTAAAVSISAAIGGLMSGIHVDNISQSVTTQQVQTGTTPDSYNVDLSKIDVHKGSGFSEVFTDLGGDPSNLQQAIDIAQQSDASFGMVPGSNGETAGAGGAIGNFAHTYPGTIDTWPAAARGYITQVAQKLAAAGLIPAEKIAGTAIFSPIEVATTHYIPNAFMNLVTQALAVAGAGVAGQTIADRGRVKSNTSDRAPRPVTPDQPPRPTGESEPPAPRNPETQNEPLALGFTETDEHIVDGSQQASDDELQQWWTEGLSSDARRYLRMVANSERSYAPIAGDQYVQMAPDIKNWIISNGVE